ncbi:MAG: DUF1775 domain-containing protein, partial [Spirillospora sp.]
MAAVAVGAGTVVLLPGTASAHVRVLSEGAEAGKPATLRFRVPSEKEVSTTVRVDVTLPKGVTADSVPAVKGWTVTQSAVGGMANGGAHIVWTARAGNEIRPADTRTFTVRADPLPKVGVLRFDTAQTYSDGSVVNWNQPSTGGQEPDFPTPELVLDPAAVPAAPPPGSAAEERSHSAIGEQPKLSATPRANTVSDASEGRDISIAVFAVAGTLAAVGLVALARRLRRAPAHAAR